MGQAVQILIVDDEPAIREILVALLSDEGYTVIEAPDGVEALRLMRATEEPMIALLDIWMPRLGGEATMLTALAQPALWGRVYFLLMTANPQRISAYAHEVIKRQGIPLLYKPFEIERLLALIAERAQRFTQRAIVERGHNSSSLT